MGREAVISTLSVAGIMQISIVEVQVMIDSYFKFMDDFHINVEELLNWGINNTFMAPESVARDRWADLKERILNNKEVYIRGAGRDGQITGYYLEFYSFAVGNKNVKRDPTNNHAPRKQIAISTGMNRNKEIANYQVSHIWGNARNVFMFEAPWNISLTPKIMDPFTGHECSGELALKYQRILREYVYNKYRDLIEDYNQLLVRYNIAAKIEEYISKKSKEMTGNEKELAKFDNFIRGVREELTPICMETDTVSVKDKSPNKTTEIDANYAKARNRIPLWAIRANQNNHKIISAYFRASEIHGRVTAKIMEDITSDVNNEKMFVANFAANFANMKTDKGNSHGKVFVHDTKSDEVWIWPIVEDVIMEFKQDFM